MKGTILILKTPGRDFFEVTWWLRCGYSQFEVFVSYSPFTARHLSTSLLLQALLTENPKQQGLEMLASMEWRKWHLHLLHMLLLKFVQCLLPSTRLDILFLGSLCFEQFFCLLQVWFGHRFRALLPVYSWCIRRRGRARRLGGFETMVEQVGSSILT